MNHLNKTPNQRLSLSEDSEGFTCIIVEDEMLPRLSLQSKLETYHPDVRILETCDDAESALESILRYKPQLLFLDIQLPGKNSIWLLEQLQQALVRMPQIIFTTAYTDPEYLLKAIKFSAADYLNKPINIVELAHAIEKAKIRILAESGRQTGNRKSIYSFRILNAQLIVTDEEIVYIQADGNYAQLKLLQGKDELIFERIGEIENKLDKAIFIRIGRSLLLNRNYIRKLNSKNFSCTLTTQNGSYTLPIPKVSYDILKDKF